MMSDSKFIDQLKPEDIVDSFVLPHGLNKAAKEKADAELSKILTQKRSGLDTDTRLKLELLQFKFLLEDYLNSKEYNEEYTFGYFLKIYLNVIHKNNKDFADEIDVTQHTLRNWLTKNKEPENEEVFVRLEFHSNNTIPAINWFKVVEKRKESRMLNSDFRLSQRSHVKRKLKTS